MISLVTEVNSGLPLLVPAFVVSVLGYIFTVDR